MTEKVLLKDATGPQMRAFAQTHLGMEFKANEANEKVRAAIAQAWQKDEIIVGEDSPPVPQAGPTREMPKNVEKVKIIIQRTEDAGGDQPVPVGVNGRVMLIPRGEEVEIPMSYFQVLQNAVKHTYESLPDGGLNPIPRKILAYPFQRVA